MSVGGAKGGSSGLSGGGAVVGWTRGLARGGMRARSYSGSSCTVVVGAVQISRIVTGRGLVIRLNLLLLLLVVVVMRPRMSRVMLVLLFSGMVRHLLVMASALKSELQVERVVVAVGCVGIVVVGLRCQ